MKFGPLAITLFAVVCIAGGLTGYLKADSVPSLVTGVGGGLVLLFCARAVKKTESQKAAFVALMLSLAIGVKFTISFFATMAVMPHLIMMMLAILSSVTAFKFARKGRRASI